MKKNKKYLIPVSLFLLLIVTLFVYLFSSGKGKIDDYTSENRLPEINPDYTGVVIPPNIAPLNFVIKEKGIRYLVKIHSANGNEINISSESAGISIPLRSWKKLLNSSRGKKIEYDVYVKNPDGSWIKYKTFNNTVANEEIDGYLVYRYIRPVHNLWRNIEIRQRNIQNYDESVIINNQAFNRGCVNCHTFLNNDPDNMLMHLRAMPGTAMLLVKNGKPKSIDSRTTFGNAPMAYSP